MIRILVKGNQPIVTKFCEKTLRNIPGFIFPPLKNPAKSPLFHIFHRFFNNTPQMERYYNP